MLVLATQDFANITVYCRKSVDGDDAEHWCINGKVHVCIARDELRWPERRAYRAEPCNGSCTAAVDMRELLKELPRVWSPREGKTRKTPVHLDGTIRALLRDEAPIVAVPYEDGYCKRNADWQYLCLDRRLHVKVSTDFAWARGKDEGFIHSVRCIPCDGCCKPTAEVDRKIIKSILREIRTMDRWSSAASPIMESASDTAEDCHRPDEQVEGVDVFRHGADI